MHLCLYGACEASEVASFSHAKSVDGMRRASSRTREPVRYSFIVLYQASWAHCVDGRGDFVLVPNHFQEFVDF